MFSMTRFFKFLPGEQRQAFLGGPGAATVVAMVGEAAADKKILDAYPDLEIEDGREALRYAAEAVREMFMIL